MPHEIVNCRSPTETWTEYSIRFQMKTRSARVTKSDALILHLQYNISPKGAQTPQLTVLISIMHFAIRNILQELPPELTARTRHARRLPTVQGNEASDNLVSCALWTKTSQYEESLARTRQRKSKETLR